MKMISLISKKIIAIFIISFAITGGFFYIFKQNQAFLNNPLFASLADFLSFDEKQNKDIPSLEELPALKQKISLLEERVAQKEGELEKLDDLGEKITNLDQKIAQLGAMIKNFNQISFDYLEEKESTKKEKEELKEKTKERSKTKEEAKEKTKDAYAVNINTASKEELQKIVGVGPVLAQRIIEARPFSSLSDLKRVKGISDKTLQEIIEQGCAFVDELYFGFSGSIIPNIKGGPPPPPPPSSPPTITLSFSKETQVNKEIKVRLSVSNLKKAWHDIKISIEKDGTISQICQIYSQTEEHWPCPKEQWQSSFNYLTNIFKETEFTGNFLLKISEEKKDFRGEADIIARVRENGKTNYLAEFKEKINITEPEEQEEEKWSKEPVNLLLNALFDEWDEPANNAQHLHHWEYSGTATHITRDEDALVGSYSVRWTPITSAHNLTQTDITITESGTYYAEIWIKPLNVNSEKYIRVSLDIADPITGTFPTADFTDYQNEAGWVKLTKTREIQIGEKAGIRIRAKRSGPEGPFLLVGAVWFGLKPPPENWLL